MKRYKPPKGNTPLALDLKRLVNAFQLVSNALLKELKRNPVVSEDELESVTGNVEDTLETVSHVLSRVLSLTESTDLHRLDDVELAVKLEREQTDILYLVDIATVCLERLHNLQHITAKEYQVLGRYWRSLPVQHQLLVERWERARNL
jgi:hypothetical protein